MTGLDAEPTWITCPECDGEGTVLDRYGLDWTCEGCDGDGGMEAVREQLPEGERAVSENRSISLRERILAALVACDYDMKGLPWRPFLDEIEIGAYERKADAVLAVLAEEGL